jgi:hypothetical protein
VFGMNVSTNRDFIMSSRHSVAIGAWCFETTYFFHFQGPKTSTFSRNIRNKLFSDDVPHVIRTETPPTPLRKPKYKQRSFPYISLTD